LVLIEPMRRTLNAPAQAFLDILRTEALNLNNLWNGYFE
jgi:hypothetical protein